jgi:hypothetical protein
VINRECPKCGQMNASVKHDSALEQLNLECVLCGYKWTAKPLDAIRADHERRLAEIKRG